MIFYSVKDTSIKLNISTRSVQKRCKRDNVRKKDNKYLITDELVGQWMTETQPNEPRTNQTNEPALEVRRNNQLDIEVESLKRQIEELKKELSNYEIGENERIEVFSNEEYILFEQRLIEWRTLQKDIEHQQELFKIEKKGSDQIIEHYKHQFEYQKQQSTRILEIHEKLIETVNSQSKITLQRNFIEAKEKGIDKE
jgi:16S rRNA C967 or C1407 C5-methylase (RsmB/RsmF family)